MADARWRDFPDILGQYMSGFLKTASNLGQKFSPLRCLKSQGASVKEGLGRKPRVLATSWFQGGGGRLYPLGVGRVTHSTLLA